MRETFEEYKSVIESNVMKFTYLYDGDVISSTDETYSEILTHNSVSPNVIIRCIIDIYNKSIHHMINRSNELSVPLRPEVLLHKPDPKVPNNIFYFLDNLEIKPLYVFCSENSQGMFGMVKKLKNDAFPGYMDFLERYNSKNYDLYLSPIIKDDINDQVEIYVTDKSIQSLVYTIQNMDYLVEKVPGDPRGEYKHTIKYKFYDCDYKSYKLTVKNISRLREDKINQVLNDN